MSAVHGDPIPLVVVESHHHVLEHIHARLRRLLLRSHKEHARKPFAWRMLHYDAHPDLSCPHSSIPAAACFRPRQEWNINQHDDDDNSVIAESADLYDMLETTTGIAEWILPLVLAGDLRHVEWVAPSQELHTTRLQIPLGQHKYRVGAWWPSQDPKERNACQSFVDLPQKAHVKVDWNCYYYRDDAQDCFVPSDELVLAQPFSLKVNNSMNDEDDHDQEMTSPWLLDICLDYFVCVNPFLQELVDLNQNFASALQKLVTDASTIYPDDNHFDRPQFLDFQSLLHELLTALLVSTEKLDVVSWVDKLQRFYQEQGLTELKSTIASLVDSIKEEPRDALVRLCRLGREALLYLHLPHFPYTDPASIDKSLRLLDHRLSTMNTSPPFMITVARSKNDGFTPEAIVEDLQERVIECVHARFCNCSERADSLLIPDRCEGEENVLQRERTECRLVLLHDYGPWEGSSL